MTYICTILYCLRISRFSDNLKFEIIHENHSHLLGKSLNSQTLECCVCNTVVGTGDTKLQLIYQRLSSKNIMQ